MFIQSLQYSIQRLSLVFLKSFKGTILRRRLVMESTFLTDKVSSKEPGTILLLLLE